MQGTYKGKVPQADGLTMSWALAHGNARKQHRPANAADVTHIADVHLKADIAEQHHTQQRRYLTHAKLEADVA